MGAASKAPIGTSSSGGAYNAANANVYADLSAATAATINQLRQAFQIQKIYERDARGGTRYTELIRAISALLLLMLGSIVLNIWAAAPFLSTLIQLLKHRRQLPNQLRREISLRWDIFHGQSWLF